MTITSKEIWDTAAEFGVSYDVAKEILEREATEADGIDPRDSEDEE